MSAFGRDLTGRAARLAKGVSATTRTLAVFLAGLSAAILLSIRYETRFLPVVTEFEITARTAGPTAVALVAEVSKARQCAFVGADMLVGDPWDSAQPRERLRLQFQTGDGSDTLEPGRQRIGPFTVSRPLTEAGPMAFLIVRHRCHPLWITEGIYFVESRDRLFPEWPNTPAIRDEATCGDG
jgi:hypothetical protein